MIPRFMARVKINEQSGCWDWQGYVQNGYGKFWFKGTMMYAHRAAFEMTLGYRPKKLVLHSCDNKLCVNPEHLREGDQRENMRECVERGRHYQTKKSACPQGHEYSGKNLYKNPYTGVRQCRECQKQHNRKLRQWKK